MADGAGDFSEKMANAPAAVKAYLKEKVRELLGNDLFIQSIQGHLGQQAGPGRIERVLKVLRDMAA
ncbi:MAG: hypothetical protein AAB412_07285 [Elusimicrobiota bacterium]